MPRSLTAGARGVARIQKTTCELKGSSSAPRLGLGLGLGFGFGLGLGFELGLGLR